MTAGNQISDRKSQFKQPSDKHFSKSKSLQELDQQLLSEHLLNKVADAAPPKCAPLLKSKGRKNSRSKALVKPRIFSTGEICFAKINGYRPWPAKVIDFLYRKWNLFS